jgi:hypothetical protein
LDPFGFSEGRREKKPREAGGEIKYLKFPNIESSLRMFIGVLRNFGIRVFSRKKSA